ncbi:hypothetical protein [Sorangium sp. So ce394]|uniref:hypothetical protein n=1 Tax=Sorangium sp. So ce394 TaxID=3133310 RepID=UPI003F5AFEAA
MLRSSLGLICAGVLSLSLAACASGTTLDPSAGALPGDGGGGGAGDAGGGGVGGGDGWIDATWVNPGPPAVWNPPSVTVPGACSELTSHHIYTVSSYSELYSFHPATLDFRFIGRFECAAPVDRWRVEAVSPLSMAVDRSGVAWIGSHSGRLARLDIETGVCEPVISPPGNDPLWRFGMAFASDGVSGEETLYLREALLGGTRDEADPVRALAMFDARSRTARPLGVGEGGDADLTGTGDGRLFGFVQGAPGEPASLSEYDKRTGAALSQTPLSGVSIHDAASWAFATWGGAFYFFVMNPDPIDRITSSVYRYDPLSGAPPELLRDDLPAEVIGAGVSTCAPTVIPQ